MSRAYDRVPFADFTATMLPAWKQNQHVSINGPTGVGKTTLIRHLLPRRDGFVVFLGTKSYDDSYDKILRTSSFHRVYDHHIPRYVDRAFVWPRPGKTPRETKAIQRDTFRRVMERIWQWGDTTLVIDELHWVCGDLKLDEEVATFHHQGRSMGLTLVDGMQRPANVPVVVHSSASHGFIWRLSEPLDVKRLASIGSLDSKEMVANMQTLSDHEFIYVPTRGTNSPPVISQTPKPGGR